MKRTLLLSALLSLSIGSFAQDANRAFAITGNGAGDFQWMNIRQIDLATGAVSKNIFENNKTKFSLVRTGGVIKGDAVAQITPAQLNTTPTADVNTALVARTPSLPTSVFTNLESSATGGVVAAAAYDQRHNKLFFTPMFLNELRWVDLSSGIDNPKFYSLSSSLLQLGTGNDEANNITRMTIGADGNGYALTNDGNHLIKFTTGKKVIITDLGGLVDASSNDHISVHNKCSCWGGDVVADALGNLYLFTASRNVFKINIDTRIATYTGSITGLSGTYTLNGAAVDNDDNVIISSANTFEGFYRVNMKDLAATKLTTTGQVFNASDLANGNLLFAGQLRNTVGAAPLIQREVIGNQFISIYPNPAIGSQFKVTFDNKLAGEYNIVLTDIQGKTIFTKQVYVKSAGQVETIQLKSQHANGMYMIKVTNASKKPVFSDKIIFD